MESLSSFILVGATIIIGVIIFSLFASYGAIYSTNTLEVQEAQYYSSGLRISSGSPAGNQIPVIINDFNYPVGCLYLIAFLIKPCYSKSASTVTPMCYALINSTVPTKMTLTVLGLSGNIIYEGEIETYKVYVGNIEFVCTKPGYYTELWVVMKIDCQFFRIGYYVAN
ncbi:hypothetical protein [Acidianus sp.]|uniref:hypothetical protein n=1 Tax=Acidianus sp. TaxID=1872104 RepID=UPI00397D7BF1